TPTSSASPPVSWARAQPRRWPCSRSCSSSWWRSSGTSGEWKGREVKRKAGSGAGMVEGARWKKWVYFYIPLTVFVVATLFPFYWMLITAFRPDGELYRPWRAANNTPLWTTQPTVEHIVYLFKHTMFGTWLYNTMFIAIISTIISLFCGLLAGYALARLRLPLARPLRTCLLS